LLFSLQMLFAGVITASSVTEPSPHSTTQATLFGQQETSSNPDSLTGSLPEALDYTSEALNKELKDDCITEVPNSPIAKLEEPVDEELPGAKYCNRNNTVEDPIAAAYVKDVMGSELDICINDEHFHGMVRNSDDSITLQKALPIYGKNIWFIGPKSNQYTQQQKNQYLIDESMRELTAIEKYEKEMNAIRKSQGKNPISIKIEYLTPQKTSTKNIESILKSKNLNISVSHRNHMVPGLPGVHYGQARGAGDNSSSEFDKLVTRSALGIYVESSDGKLVEFDGLVRSGSYCTFIDAKAVKGDQSIYGNKETFENKGKHKQLIDQLTALNNLKNRMENNCCILSLEWVIANEEVAKKTQDIINSDEDIQELIKKFGIDFSVVHGPLTLKELEEGSSGGANERLAAHGKSPVPVNSQTTAAIGGIDFSTLDLRYIADSAQNGKPGLQYAFNAIPASNNKNIKAGQTAVMQVSDSFFVYLALSPDKFWVNLNPNEPDRVIDPLLATTDVGRIMLQADLQLKKSTARLIHPDTSLGHQYWQKLDWQDTHTCFDNRVWIIPAAATIREEGNGIYIQDAPLGVKLESETISKTLSGKKSACPKMNKSTMAHNESVFRELILPRIVQAVNTAPEYAELRRIYRGRIAAEWYRQRSQKHKTAYRALINGDDVSPWPAQQKWSPQQVFDQYVSSYSKGEFNVTNEWQEGSYFYTETYTYGGIDFSKIFFKKLNLLDFQKKWGDLPQVLNNSMTSPTADRHGKIWLAGSTVMYRTVIWKSMWFYLVLSALAVLFFVYRVHQHKRRV
jgi:hypothetical protein